MEEEPDNPNEYLVTVDTELIDALSDEDVVVSHSDKYGRESARIRKRNVTTVPGNVDYSVQSSINCVPEVVFVGEVLGITGVNLTDASISIDGNEVDDSWYVYSSFYTKGIDRLTVHQ